MRLRALRNGIRDGDRTVQAVMLEGFLNRLGFGIVTFALPLYALKLGLGLTEIGIVVAAKAFVQPAVKPLMGLLIDRLGARRGYLVAVSFRFASALVLPFASSMGALIAVRMLQGAASAAQDPAAITLIAKQGDGTRLGRRFAATMSARDLGKVSAGLIGGLLLAATGSFLVLWIAVAAIAALPVFVVWRWVHDVPAIPAVTEPTAPAPDPSVAHRVLRDPRLRLVAALGLLAGTTAHMTNALFQVYASEVAGLSAAQIGLITSLSIAALLGVGPPAGWIADRFGTGALSSARGIANAGSSLLYLVFPVFGGMLAGRLVDDAGKAAFRPTWGALVGGATRRAGPRGGRVAATLDAALSLGEALGPLLAAVLWDTFGFVVFLSVRAGLGIATELLLGRRLRVLERTDRGGTEPTETLSDEPLGAWLVRSAPGARPEEIAHAWSLAGLAAPLQAAWAQPLSDLTPDDRTRLPLATALAGDPIALARGELSSGELAARPRLAVQPEGETARWQGAGATNAGARR